MKINYRRLIINTPLFTFFVDGDACPVKDVIFTVVKRFQLNTILVSASPIKVQPFIKNHVVKSGFNSADDWIAEQIQKYDLLATADIELADRALKKNAFAIDFKGGIFDDDNIGRYKASRDLMGVLRDTKFDFEKKIKPRTTKDSSAFANGLNNIIQKIIRKIEKNNLDKQFDKNTRNKE